MRSGRPEILKQIGLDYGAFTDKAEALRIADVAIRENKERFNHAGDQAAHHPEAFMVARACPARAGGPPTGQGP